jgi:hypothetical protein
MHVSRNRGKWSEACCQLQQLLRDTEEELAAHRVEIASLKVCVLYYLTFEPISTIKCDLLRASESFSHATGRVQSQASAAGAGRYLCSYAHSSSIHFLLLDVPTIPKSEILFQESLISSLTTQCRPICPLHAAAYCCICVFFSYVLCFLFFCVFFCLVLPFCLCLCLCFCLCLCLCFCLRFVMRDLSCPAQAETGQVPGEASPLTSDIAFF